MNSRPSILVPEKLRRPYLSLLSFLSHTPHNMLRGVLLQVFIMSSRCVVLSVCPHLRGSLVTCGVPKNSHSIPRMSLFSSNLELPNLYFSAQHMKVLYRNSGSPGTNPINDPCKFTKVCGADQCVFQLSCLVDFLEERENKFP